MNHLEKKMSKRKLAQIRNFALFRLKGFHVPLEGLTEEECEKIMRVRNLLDSIQANWDQNTELKLDTKLKPYKCDFCGRRSNVERVIQNDWGLPDLTLCKKHYEEVKESIKQVADY